MKMTIVAILVMKAMTKILIKNWARFRALALFAGVRALIHKPWLGLLILSGCAHYEYTMKDWEKDEVRITSERAACEMQFQGFVGRDKKMLTRDDVKRVEDYCAGQFPYPPMPKADDE